MQINRLFEIVYVLLDEKTVTAAMLAQRFEVSVRTIYRDVEILSSAGIPVFMSKGKGGGIRLVDGFVLNKSLLCEQEQKQILAALYGLRAIHFPDVGEVLAKLSMLFQKDTQDWIEVDFSSWDDNTDKWNLLKTAILNKTAVSFDYYGSNGEKTQRSALPVKLWFKEKTWYLRAFCLQKQSMRTFKLTRMKNLQAAQDAQLVPNSHDCTSEPPSQSPAGVPPLPFTTLQLRIDASQAYRVYDEFEERQIVKNPDNSFTVTATFLEDGWVYGYILSFGCFAQVVYPLHIRGIIKEMLQKSLQHYL